MSIPDDPFTKDTREMSTTAGTLRDDGPPVLELQTGSPEGISSPRIMTSPPPVESTSPPSPRDSSPQSPTRSTPGGTLLVPGSVPGAKTPRRVQWTSDSHMVSMHEIQAVDSSVVDEANLRHLDNALERHRSRSSNKRRPASMLSSAASSAGDELTDGEDYDYRLDVDPPTLRPVTSAGSQSNPEHDSLQQLLGNDINQHVTEYIPLGETDGLPNITQDQTDRSAAKDLVRAHTGKWGTLRRRVRGAGAVNRTFGNGAHDTDGDDEKSASEARHRSQNAFAARYPDTDQEDADDIGQPPMRRPSHAAALQGMPGVPGGASVLSSLLALYGQQNEPESGQTSAASSRPTSDDEDSSEDERRRTMTQNNKGRKASLFQRAVDTVSPGNATPAEAVPERQPLETKPADMFTTHHRTRSTTSLVDRMERERHPKGFMAALRKAREQIEDFDRPEAARSGAGVFGALMQNTANLSGVATPAASALTPAARRPGYQLNRFSMPVDDGQVRNRPWRPPSRPTSTMGSRPGSIHSSTAVSAGDEDSPKAKLPKTLPADDTIPLKEAKPKKTPKTLTLDSIHKLPVAALKEGGHALKNAERWISSGGKTPLLTPPEKALTDYFTRPLTEDELRRREREKEKKKRKKAREARKKQEIYVSCQFRSGSQTNGRLFNMLPIFCLDNNSS